MPGRHLLVCFPRVRLLLAHVLLVAATCTQAAEPSYFKFSDLMNSDSGRALHDPAVKLYWATQPTPEFAEVAPPDVYARRGHCPRSRQAWRGSRTPRHDARGKRERGRHPAQHWLPGRERNDPRTQTIH